MNHWEWKSQSNLAGQVDNDENVYVLWNEYYKVPRPLPVNVAFGILWCNKTSLDITKWQTCSVKIWLATLIHTEMSFSSFKE